MRGMAKFSAIVDDIQRKKSERNKARHYIYVDCLLVFCGCQKHEIKRVQKKKKRKRRMTREKKKENKYTAAAAAILLLLLSGRDRMREIRTTTNEAK